MRNSFKLAAVAALALSASVLGSAAANANPIYLLYSVDGGSTYIPFGSSSTGVASGSVVVNTFTISAQAIGSPTVTAPNFQSTTLDVKSTGAGTLSVAAVETGLTTPTVTGFSLGFTSNAGTTVPMTESFAVQDSKGVFTTLASSTLAPNTATAFAVPYVSAANYSIIELYSVSFGATGGTINATISETGIPEPMTLSLLGAGLVGMGAMRMRRKG